MRNHCLDNNIRTGLSLFKYKSFGKFDSPKSSQILDIYSVMVL